MADLDVQPKRSSPWWLWLLIALIVIVILIFLFRGCNSETTTVTTTDSTSTRQTVAVTKPDWNAVDFSAARTKDEDVTDTAIAVSSNDRYTIYTLGENILFATDQNSLNTDAGDKLKQIVASLDKHFKGASIGVYGNTDSTGTAGHNQTLGAERAAAVKDWLVQSGGLDSSLISIHSFGETKPVASNGTASGRQENRNVSIVAFPNK